MDSERSKAHSGVLTDELLRRRARSIQDDVEELLKRRAASDDRAGAKRQADVAAIREKWGITDRPPPEWPLWQARRKLLDALYRRLEQMQQQPRGETDKEPVPKAGWWAWDDLQRHPTGRPERLADLALIDFAGNVAPELAESGFQTALSYAVLLDLGIPEEGARRRVLARPPVLSEGEYNRVKALERHAQRIKKNRTTQSP